jgi:Eisosome component PIL1
MCIQLGHALRRQTAGQFGPDLAKKLSQLVKMEKNVMRSMELVGRERMEVAVCFQIWRKTTISQLTTL